MQQEKPGLRPGFENLIMETLQYVIHIFHTVVESLHFIRNAVLYKIRNGRGASVYTCGEGSSNVYAFDMVNIGLNIVSHF